MGVTIDTTDCTTLFGEAKLAVLYDKLLCFSLKTRASKRQLQSLAGSLNWACQVIQGGRYFLRRILDSINKLKLASHKCKLSAEFLKDLDWWLCYLREFNGVLYYHQVDSAVVHTDTCVEGAGIFVNSQWYYANWRQDFPHLVGLHINYKEVMAAILGVCHFAPILAECDVTIVTDSTAAKGILNKGRCRSPMGTMVMEWLRLLFWTSLNFSLKIRAVHCPGLLNQLPDVISRLHEPGQVLRLYSLLSNLYHGVPSVHFASQCGLCMSPASFQVVAPHLERWAMGLQAQLDKEVADYRAVTFASSAKRAYSTHRNRYFEFCGKLGVPPVPASSSTIAQYSAYLARSMQPALVRQFLNIIHILHLESDLPNPLQDNKYVKSTLAGIDRLLGVLKIRRTPIHLDLLIDIYPRLDFSTLIDTMFLAACMLMFFWYLQEVKLVP